MNKHCLKCNAIGSLVGIVDRACGNSYLYFPNGKEYSGYLPNVQGLCDSDGLNIEICVECGQINGLDLVALKKELINNSDYEE